MQITSIADVLDYVEEAGQDALAAQREMRFHDRAFKEDGSILTVVDEQVEQALHAQIAGAYPGANVLGEETVRAYDRERAYTFVIDPIDGTDVYSQGMHGWCVSVGLLDAALRPVAGVLYAPRLDLLFYADVGRPATLNGDAIRPPAGPATLTGATNVMAYSKAHTQFGWGRYPGKVRGVGSVALHLCFTLIYPGVYGAIEGRDCYIWDVAGAHAILRSHGYALEYLRGGSIDYARMVDGGTAGDVLLGGRPDRIQALREVLVPL